MDSVNKVRDEITPNFADHLPSRRTLRRGGHGGRGGLAIILVILLAVALLAHSPLFSLTLIEMSGNRRLTPLDVQAAAGVRMGTPLWRIDERAVERALLALPLVREAHVASRFPRTLEVTVVEREAIGLVPYFQFVLAIDAEGRALELVPTDLAPDLPLVTGVEVPSVLLGEQVRLPSLDVAQRALSALAAHAPTLSEVHITDDGVLTIYTRDPFPIYLGKGPHSEETFLRLDAVLRAVREDGTSVAYIDMSSGGVPVVKPK